MNDELNKRGKALEDGYFAQKDHRILEKLNTKASIRLCPADQTKLTTIMQDGVEIDVCEKCGGLWLDNGELEKIIAHSKEQNKSWLDELINKIV